MTIDDTAPIHELDRLLDGIAGDEWGAADAEWAPTLRRLARLDDGLAPPEEVLRDIRQRVVGAAERPVVGTASALGASTSSNGVGNTVASTGGGIRRRDERRRIGVAAAAAVLLLAVGSVWLGRGAGNTPPAPAPWVAMTDGAPVPPPPELAAEPPPSAVETMSDAASVVTPRSGATGDSGAPRDRGPIAAADVVRASIGGLGSDDLVGLLAIGAETGQREYAATRDQVLQEVDASWTAFVEERRWEDLLGVPPSEAADRPWSPRQGAG